MFCIGIAFISEHLKIMKFDFIDIIIIAIFDIKDNLRQR